MAGSAERGAESRARASLRALGAVLSSPRLRRLQLAWAGSILGGWAYLVALGVYAYEQGGAGAVGLVGLIRLVPAAIASPFTATLADRYSRVSVMVASDLVRFGLMVAAAVVIATDGPAPVVYGLVAVTTVAGTVFRPAQAALLPSLVASPAELTAANVTSSTLESVGTFLGPALGGLLLAVSDSAVVFAVNGATFLWSAILVMGLRGTEQPREPVPVDGAPPDASTGIGVHREGPRRPEPAPRGCCPCRAVPSRGFPTRGTWRRSPRRRLRVAHRGRRPPSAGPEEGADALQRA